jgi:hypothetical protein
LKQPVQQSPERRRVDEASGRGHRIRAARQQSAAPSHAARRQIPQIDPEHVVNADAGPDLGKILDLLGERLRPRGQVGGIDPAGGDTGEDSGKDFRKLAREDAEKANLIGRPGASAAQHQREV